MRIWPVIHVNCSSWPTLLTSSGLILHGRPGSGVTVVAGAVELTGLSAAFGVAIMPLWTGAAVGADCVAGTFAEMGVTILTGAAGSAVGAMAGASGATGEVGIV